MGGILSYVTIMADRLLTLGHGYCAAALAASLGRGWRVTGVTRSADRAAAMDAAGIEPVLWDDGRAVSEAILGSQCLLVSTPPGPGGDPVLTRHEKDVTRARPAWVGYLSTVGVYGDSDGGWVEEDTPPAPGSDRARRRLAAERAWAGTGLPVHVFRLPGIYGPGRSALDRLRRGDARRIVKPGHVFSRIHVDDIAAALGASILRPAPGRTYNVADDLPAPPQDVISFAAELLGLPAPPEVAIEDADLSPMARSFFAECRRVGNRRVKAELGLQLRHPDYRAGLRAIHAEGG